jgi:pimeloyl-ACP methyl ester carboxylesterase
MDGGDGPSVVMLHGLIGSGAYLRPAAARLAGHGARVLVPDLPGHGRSDRLHDASPARVAGLLSAAVARLAPEPPLLVGHSLGAAVALAWAAALPVRGVVLVSPVGVSRLPVGSARWAVPAGRLLAARLRGAAARDRRVRRLVFGWFVGMRRLEPLDAETAAELLAEAGLAAAGIADYLPAIAQLDVRPLLEEVSAPTTVIWGDGDAVAARDGPVLAAGLNARRVVLAGVGHMPMLEAPGDFDRAVARAALQ